MASRRQSPAPSKRTLALKRADGEPLTRADIQYDVLHAIFHDKTLAFTDPYNTAEDAPKLCFRDLYIKALMHSSKATKALRDKMTESSVFAEDLAMLAMLVNVGRINTTMSFFPEMKTTIRTYHPIPTLQRTSGNMQDAPRIKHILKQALLERETDKAPTTPDEVLEQARNGHIPSTSVPNLLFVLSGHSMGVGPLFSQRFEFLDIFLRTDISSASRARAFLWLCFNYLENPGSATDDYDEEEKPNPFVDPTKGSAPFLISLTPDEALLENVDTPEEIALCEKMVANREEIRKQNALKESAAALAAELGGSDGVGAKVEAVDQALPADSSEVQPALSKAKGRRKPGRAAADKPAKRGRATGAASRKDALKKDAAGKGSQAGSTTQGSTGTPHDGMSVDDNGLLDVDSEATNPSPFRILEGKDPSSTVEGGRAPRRGRAAQAAQRRYSPYPRTPEPQHKPRALRHVVPEHRTMMEHAWYIVNNTDPLLDSDDEGGGDEHDRHEYIQRLKVVKQYTPGWTEPSHILRRLDFAMGPRS